MILVDSLSRLEKFIPLFMSLLKGPNIFKYCLITNAAALVLIAINTILISQKSTRNADSFKMELKNLSSNLKSLKNEIKNISIDLFPSKNNLKGGINVLTINPFGLIKREKSCGIG